MEQIVRKQAVVINKLLSEFSIGLQLKAYVKLRDTRFSSVVIYNFLEITINHFKMFHIHGNKIR